VGDGSGGTRESGTLLGSTRAVTAQTGLPAVIPLGLGRALSGKRIGMDGPDLRSHSLHELISSLTEQLSHLVRAELALARAELFASGRQAAVGGGLLTGAAVVGFTAWLAMVAAVIAGIAEGLPVWASALIIGGALGTLAGILALLGRARLARGMPPLAMTTDTVRRDLHELTSRPGTNGTATSVPGQRPAPGELQSVPQQKVP